MTQGLRVGLLYPTPHSGEDDFWDLAAQLDPVLNVEVLYMPWPDDVDDLTTLDLDQMISMPCGDSDRPPISNE